MTWKMQGGVFAGILVLITFAASAETVFVDADFGEKGNGWLFGSRADERCWIAVPWHVVSAGDGTAKSFRWSDQSNRSGESGQPFHAVDIPGVSEMGLWVEDLAFARVTAGRADGACLSRLGLPSDGYIEALRSDAPLLLTYLEEGTIVPFEVERQRALADESRGAVMLLRARNPSDNEVLVGGISGAVAEQRWQGHLRPTAMIVDQPPAGEVTARAIRFDHIRAAFEAFEASLAGETPQPEGTSALAFDIVGIVGKVAPGSAPLSGLAGGCWKARPVPGARVVEIILSVPAEGRRVSNLRLGVTPECGPEASAIIETRASGAPSWTVSSTNCPVRQAGTCRVGRATPREIRIRIDAQMGWVGLSEIAVE